MVLGTRINKLAAEIVAGHFQILSGEPLDLGGDDDGPSPHQLLEAALSACTILTLQMYANRKQMNLTECKATVKIESESAEASTISRTLEFEGDLSQEDRQRLLEIANKCPIHKLLSSRISINTKLVP